MRVLCATNWQVYGVPVRSWLANLKIWIGLYSPCTSRKIPAGRVPKSHKSSTSLSRYDSWRGKSNRGGFGTYYQHRNMSPNSTSGLSPGMSYMYSCSSTTSSPASLQVSYLTYFLLRWAHFAVTGGPSFAIGGQAVIVLAFYSDNPSSISAYF